MEFKKTQRGFGLIEFKDNYNQKCSIQESSANGSLLWIGIDDPNPQILSSQAEKNNVEKIKKKRMATILYS